MSATTSSAQQRSGVWISHHLPACLEDTEPLCQQPGCSLHYRAYTRQLNKPPEPGPWGHLHGLSYHLTACSQTVATLQAQIVQSKFGLKVAVQLLQNSGPCCRQCTSAAYCCTMQKCQWFQVCLAQPPRPADHYMVWSTHKHLFWWSNSFRALRGSLATA